MVERRSISFVSMMVFLIIVSGCTTSTGSSAPTHPGMNTTPVQKVEVFHFHLNQQCPSCSAIGDLAEETVNENFKNELASGRLVFAHVNAEQPGNASLAEKYGVTGSSLWIGVYDFRGFHKEQDIRVWSLVNDKTQFKTYLSGVIAKRLNGDLS